VKDTTWYLVAIVLTLLQHETAVAMWYHHFVRYFQNHFTAALEALVIISLLDIAWLYLQFLFFRASFDKLSHVARIHAWLEQIQLRQWFRKVRPYFTDNNKTADPGESRFRRMIRNSGYFGIFLCATLPGPGFKEIGIVVALAPKYKDHGFVVMYIGGIVKTILTLLIFTGLSKAFGKLFENIFQ
jgi:hypothetical protein